MRTSSFLAAPLCEDPWSTTTHALVTTEVQRKAELVPAAAAHMGTVAREVAGVASTAARLAGWSNLALLVVNELGVEVLRSHLDTMSKTLAGAASALVIAHWEGGGDSGTGTGSHGR